MSEEFKLIASVNLGGSHTPTGRTRHYAGTTELPPPHSLQIVKSPEDDGYYLFYLDDNGRVQTDTYHETLEGALGQADFEFSVNRSEWRFADEHPD